MPCAPLSMLDGPDRTAFLPELPNVDNDAHGTEKLMLNSQVSEDFA